MIQTGALFVTLALSTVGSATQSTFAQVYSDTSCIVMDFPVEGRLSPIDSLSFSVGEGVVKVCYGRPSARGRTMIGGRDVPYGAIWRTGANEPTMIHTTEPIHLSGIAIDRGTYSLYTIPGEDEWTIIVNRSVTQWGHIARYTYKVKELEVGRVNAARQRPDEHVETLTFRTEPGPDDQVHLILEWEHSRIRIPILAAGG